MRTRLTRISIARALAMLISISIAAGSNAQPSASPEADLPDTPGARIVRTASAWLDSLEPSERYRTLYDFGDSWLHNVTLIGTSTLAERFTRELQDGARAFPPEDCGGLPGYEDCVAVLETGEDPEGIREWIGDWRPEAFDLQAERERFDR